jgi:hypothetical protein
MVFERVDEPALNVIPVDVPISHVVAQVHVVAPSVSARVLELLEENCVPDVAPTVCPLVSKVPFVKVMTALTTGLRASWSCQVPPTPSKVIDPRRYAALVILFVPVVDTNLIRDVEFGANVIPAVNLNAPLVDVPTLSCAEEPIVIVRV